MIPPIQFGSQLHPADVQLAANFIQPAAEHCRLRKEVVAVLINIRYAYGRDWRDALLHNMLL